MRELTFFLIAVLLVTPRAHAGNVVGASACAVCHAAIAQSQANTPMALTWRGPLTSLLPNDLNVSGDESLASDLTFALRKIGPRLEASSARAGDKVTIPVTVVMGGERHGLSFLASIDRLGDIPLARPALVETRFAWSAANRRLVLSPGFPEDAPHTLDTALGVALSPTLETKCVTCHGQPVASSQPAAGVHCESCHGPGGDHLLAVGKGKPREGIVNPARLDADAQMAVCARCHTGFSRQSDPLPDDLLVSNQVNALSNSECYIQSAKAVGCTSCHNPHEGPAKVQAVSVKACLGCHAPLARVAAATCPVNAKSGCIGCHMPSIQKGSFHMVDHWIRIHPEQNVSADPARRAPSKVIPLREFIRVISTPARADADRAIARLSHGEDFFQVAREVSKDPSAPLGGYLGATWLPQLDPRLARAAATLAYGQVSEPIDLDDHWIVLQRLPRNFKYDAALLYDRAALLRTQGDVKGALEKYQQSLILYPLFLRALIGMGTQFAENGNIANGAGVLQFAAQSYLDDAAAEFNYGLTLGGLGRHAEEIAAYRRAIELDPDLDAAYENLGAACSSNGDPQGAIKAFRKGLQIDPLSSVLYYDLSLVLAQAGDSPGAANARTLALKIDPRLTHRAR